MGSPGSIVSCLEQVTGYLTPVASANSSAYAGTVSLHSCSTRSPLAYCSPVLNSNSLSARPLIDNGMAAGFYAELIEPV